METTQEPLTLAEASEAARDIGALGAGIGIPPEAWGNRCHEVSLALLRTGKFGPGRIARGFHPLVRGQHSWIVLGDDCYDPHSVIVDPTIFAHMADKTPRIIADFNNKWYRPHGSGNIFDHPMPHLHDGEPVELTPSVPLSREAQDWLGILGPLDVRGWGEMAHLPVEGWPAGEIIAAMADTPVLKALIPIDILGMTTDRNPGGQYR